VQVDDHDVPKAKGRPVRKIVSDHFVPVEKVKNNSKKNRYFFKCNYCSASIEGRDDNHLKHLIKNMPQAPDVTRWTGYGLQGETQGQTSKAGGGGSIYREPTTDMQWLPTTTRTPATVPGPRHSHGGPVPDLTTTPRNVRGYLATKKGNQDLLSPPIVGLKEYYKCSGIFAGGRLMHLTGGRHFLSVRSNVH